KMDVGLASDAILDPEQLEPTTRKQRAHQRQIVEGGSEVQIKIGSLKGRTKRRGLVIPAQHLGDTRDVNIKSKPLDVNIKKTPSHTAVAMGSTSNVGTIENPPQKLKSKSRVHAGVTIQPT